MTTLEEIKYVTDIARNIGKNLRDDGIISMKDLISEGWIALQAAKRRYDPGRGSTLRTYAYRRVCGAMLDAIYRVHPRGYRRQGGSGVPIPVDVCEYEEDDQPCVDDIEARVELGHVADMIGSGGLSRRERDILLGRAVGEELRPLAARHGISRTRVWQIQREAREKIRVVVPQRKKVVVVARKK